MQRKPMPSQEYLNHLFTYDPYTGYLFWKNPTGSKIKSGSRAGYLDKSNGYFHVGFDGKHISTQRVIWKMVHGNDPDVIDHRNRCRSDNRICNLRDVTQKVNTQNRTKHSNNKSGIAGVCWSQKDNKWVAYCNINERVTYLGGHKCKAMAGIARMLKMKVSQKSGLHPLGTFHYKTLAK